MKNMNITLCPTVLIGDIPNYSFNDKSEAMSFIVAWLQERDFDKEVFVCFCNNRNLPNEFLRDEQTAFLVTHDIGAIEDFTLTYVECCDITEDFDFAIFGFENYQEAFKYCIDLKESF